MKRRFIFYVVLILFLLVGGFLIYNNFVNHDEFTRTSLIRINVPLGGEWESELKVTNSEKIPQDFNIYLNDFHGLANLSDTSFTLGPKESKDISIFFEDSLGEPGVYVGKLNIETPLSRGDVPIVLGIEDPHSVFAIIQSNIQRYDDVYPGGKFGTDIKVFDLIGTGDPAVDAYYEIKNFDNEVILEGNTNLIVDGIKTEIIDIPSNWMKEDYVFIIYIDYKDTLSFSTYLFSVSNKSNNFLLDGSNFFGIVLVAFALLILGFIVYFIKTRDSLLVKLKEQQNREIKRNVVYINNYKKSVKDSRIKPEKKKLELRKLDNVKRKIIKQIKEKQKKQKKEVSKLKKKKTRKNKIQSKMDDWKKEGYKMVESKKEFKGSKPMKDQLKEWEKKGYDTSALKK